MNTFTHNGDNANKKKIGALTVQIKCFRIRLLFFNIRYSSGRRTEEKQGVGMEDNLHLNDGVEVDPQALEEKLEKTVRHRHRLGMLRRFNFSTPVFANLMERFRDTPLPSLCATTILQSKALAAPRDRQVR